MIDSEYKKMKKEAGDKTVRCVSPASFRVRYITIQL